MVSPQIKQFKKVESYPIEKIIKPFQDFIRLESSSGIIIILCVLTTLIWVNSEFTSSYEELWRTKFTISYGDFKLSKDLILWINDFLMAIFFFLVGLEIKREVLIGELSSFKQAILPVIGAIGGMVFPAIIYLSFNFNNSEGFDGWAIPMATDIAFALGIMMLFRHRIPLSMKVFLTSIAIVDDIGAILIIALFFTSKLYLDYLIGALVVLLILLGANRIGVRHPFVYILLGFVLWVFILKSGIHATIAGVLLAFTIPATTKMDYKEFQEKSILLFTDLSKQDAILAGTELKSYQNVLQTLEIMCQNVESPLQRIEHTLAPYVIFLIMPVFALANGGVSFKGQNLDTLIDPITFGVFFGLALGKPLGIGLSVFLASQLGIGKIPEDVDWYHIFGVGCLAGIGFTMSTFISNLAFTEPSSLVLAKIGILFASLLSAIVGLFLLTRCGQDGCEY